MEAGSLHKGSESNVSHSTDTYILCDAEVYTCLRKGHPTSPLIKPNHICRHGDFSLAMPDMSGNTFEIPEDVL